MLRRLRQRSIFSGSSCPEITWRPGLSVFLSSRQTTNLFVPVHNILCSNLLASVDYFVDDKQRPLSHLVVSTVDVFADKSQGDKLNPAKEGDGEDQSDISLWQIVGRYL